MRKFITTSLGALFLAVLAPAGMADNGGSGSIHWQTIIGITQAHNYVLGFTGDSEPWSTLGGDATVDPVNNTVEFEVKGLVLAGGSAIGTRGGVSKVEGTLVCGRPGGTLILDASTPPVALSPQGNAEFSGSFTTSAALCSPGLAAFLITIASNGLWIANGAVRAP